MDQDVRLNRAYPQQKQPQKVPEDSRGLNTETEGEMPPPVGWPAPGAHLSVPHCYVSSPLPPRLHIRHPLSWFDPRAHVGCSDLYILARATPRNNYSHQVI